MYLDLEHMPKPGEHYPSYKRYRNSDGGINESSKGYFNAATGMNLGNILSEEARCKMLHIVLFCLYKLSRKGKP